MDDVLRVGGATCFAGSRSGVGASGPETCLPLRMVGEGEWARIVGFQGGCGAIDRLAGLGLHSGTCLRVESNSGQGSVVVSVEGRRLFLGGGMAQRIQVAMVRGGME